MEVLADDGLFLHGGGVLPPLGLTQHLRREALVVRLQPRRHLAGELGGVADHLARAGARMHGDHVVVPQLIAGDVHAAAIDGPVSVEDQLARLPARSSEPKAHEHVVEPALEHPQEVLARDAALPRSLVVVDAELLLEHAVVALGLLLLTQLHPILALLLAAAAVLTRRIGAALDAALVGEAALALEEQLLSLTPTLLALGSGIAGHQTRLRLRGRQPL